MLLKIYNKSRTEQRRKTWNPAEEEQLGNNRCGI